MSELKKRFIAGAVCPRCAKMDKIVMYRENDIETRECISCGYKDEMRFKPLQREIETRVNTTEEQKKSEVQVLVLDPAARSSDNGKA